MFWMPNLYYTDAGFSTLTLESMEGWIPKLLLSAPLAANLGKIFFNSIQNIYIIFRYLNITKQ